MRNRPSLQDFIDDELLRVPMTLDLVVDAVHHRWRERLPTQGRGTGIDPARVLQQHRNELTARAVAVLRKSAHDELRLLQAGNTPQAQATEQRSARAAPLAAVPSLTLIDEDDVAVDIEIARCTQAVKLQAEVVLRELQTYTSGLINDANVARDTNPFRPERMVRALWDGVQMLPMARPLMAAFLQDAAQPLATILQRAYGAACRRLEEQGVEPASYRTIVVSGSTVWGQTTSRHKVPTDLHTLRSSMPVPGSIPIPIPGPMPISAAPAPVPGHLAVAGTQAAAGAARAAQGGPDPQLIELLARLFEAIQGDLQLPPDTVSLMQRLQPTALRVALRDPSLLDRYDHALWRFMDQLAHDIALCAPAQRARLLGLGRNLIDHLAQTEPRDSHGFAWALERLLAAQRHALNQAITAAQPTIDKLERIAADQASATTGSMPLDIATLDTVPAALMAEPPASPGAPSHTGLPPGATLRAYLQGERRTLVSLWQDRQHDLTLLREPATEQLFPVHQRAMARLQSEGLAHTFKVRSLVRRSAEKVMRGL
ncbi:MAG: DUF1631 family protein [Aquabacterium sp.]|nr:DUF1631 family protein [Aquabacterium sp.]